MRHSPTNHTHTRAHTQHKQRILQRGNSQACMLRRYKSLGIKPTADLVWVKSQMLWSGERKQTDKLQAK